MSAETDRPVVEQGRKDKSNYGKDVNEIIAHEWLSLHILWDIARADVSDASVKAKIDAVFPKEPVWRSGPSEWYNLNAASQLVGAHLTESQLGVEFQILLGLARNRKISNLAIHEKNAQIFDQPTASNLEQRRACYLALLDELQRLFINTRFNRALRQQTATRLMRTGVFVLGCAIVPFVIYFFILKGSVTPEKIADAQANGTHLLFSSTPVFGLLMVAAYGLLGAFFSRVMMFQTQLATIGFEDVMNTYQGRMIHVRLLYGTIGAIIFYFVLRSGIIGGSAFPDLSKISIGEQVVWKSAASSIEPASDNTKLAASGLTILAPTIDLAKLLVWSFLAGFSERLVPETLEKTTAKSNGTNA